MNLSAPTMPIFIISLVIAIVALLLAIGIIPPFGVSATWVALIGYAVLLAGNLLKGV